MPGKIQPTPDSKPKARPVDDSSRVPRPSLRWVLWTAGALALAALGGGWAFWHGHSAVPPLQGGILTWSTQRDKESLAAYLNGNVLVPGFEAKVVAVAKKQNYWSLAKATHTDIDTIVGFNPDMEHLNAYLGRPVLMSDQVGTLHQVRLGDSPESVEKDYGLDPGDLRAANRVGWLGLKPGQVLFLPGAKPLQLTQPMAEAFARRRLFRSPLAGHYTSLVGVRIDPFTGQERHHNGVDIKAPFNSLVAAAADGTVTLAGWNDGFGKCIIIDHNNGYRTLYGHLNALMVRSGQKVHQNQFIGRVGMTGRTTGPHLHFTIWKDGKVQNPLKYLW